MTGAGQNILEQNTPCHFLTPRTKHPTKICHRGQNIPCCFCHPGHNIPCCFCSFRVSLIWDLHLLLHVLAVNALVRLRNSKWRQKLNNHRILKRLAKAQTSLRICAGCSEPLLVAHSHCWKSRVKAHLLLPSP